MLLTYLILQAIYFCDIREEEIFEKIKCRKNLVRPFICIERRKPDPKIYRRETTFHQKNAKINSCENK